MDISVLNHSKIVSDEELQVALRSINRQIREDFEPYWSMGATLRLEGRSEDKPNGLKLADMRGDAVLYLWDDVNVQDALGYHDRNASGIPFGFVFTKLAQQLGEDWSVTLSHEALELIADPLVNLLVAGPHPTEDRVVFHWFEMADAVQAESYEIDGVHVSNFVLPLYFTPTGEDGSRNDFLGRTSARGTLTSFGINPGGYIGFFDPQLQQHVTFAGKDDAAARTRLNIKRQQRSGRRAYRITSSAPTKNAEIQSPMAGRRTVPSSRKPTAVNSVRID